MTVASWAPSTWHHHLHLSIHVHYSLPNHIFNNISLCSLSNIMLAYFSQLISYILTLHGYTLSFYNLQGLKKKKIELVWGSSMNCAMHCVKAKGQDWALLLQFAIKTVICNFGISCLQISTFDLDRFRLYFLLFTLKSKAGYNLKRST